MTDQPGEQQVPLFDLGNPFVEQLYPTFPVFGVASTPAGPLLVFTLRSGPATLTVNLTRDQAIDFARKFTIAAEKVPILHVAKDGLVVPHRNNAGGDGSALITP